MSACMKGYNPSKLGQSALPLPNTVGSIVNSSVYQTPSGVHNVNNQLTADRHGYYGPGAGLPMLPPSAGNAVMPVPLDNTTALRSFTHTTNEMIGPGLRTQVLPPYVVNSDETRSRMNGGLPAVVTYLLPGNLPSTVYLSNGCSSRPAHTTYTHPPTHPYPANATLGENAFQQRRLTDLGTPCMGRDAMFSVVPHEAAQVTTQDVNVHGLMGSSYNNPSMALNDNNTVPESQSRMTFDQYVSEVLLPGLPPPPLGMVAPTAMSATTASAMIR